MSTEESILEEVKLALESDADLIAALGGTPNDFYWNAEENESPPYMTYRIEEAEQVDNAIYTGKLVVDLWYYDTNASAASEVEEIIVSILDGKYVYNDIVPHCAFYHNTEGRKKAGVKPLTGNKNGIIDMDAIYKCIVWDCRWVSKTRATKRMYP